MTALLFSWKALVVVAGLAIAVVAFPWSLSAPITYRGLDPNLLYVGSTSGGTATFGSGRALLMSQPRSQVRLDLVTTMDDFATDFTVTVKQTDGIVGAPSIPIGARFWFPRSGTSISLRFLSGADHEIVGTVFNGQNEAQRVLGSYVVGMPYHVYASWRAGRSGSFRVAGPDGAAAAYSIDRASGLALFDDRYVNLSLDSVARESVQSALVSEFSLSVPPQTTFASKATDSRLIVLTLLILMWFLGYIAYEVRGFWRPQRRRSSPVNESQPESFLSSKWRLVMVLVPGLVVLIAAYALLAPVDAHPYDRLAQESYAYVSTHYGLAAIYDRTNYIGDTAVRGGYAPWSNVPLAYPPLMSYPYWLIGKVWTLVGGVIAPLHDRPFEVFWKLAFAVFVLLNAFLVYQLYRNQRDWRWALLAAAVYAFNPAIMFDAVVWGETEAIVASGLILAAFGFVKGKPRLGWSALVVAILLKQTALFALPLMAIYSVKRYGWRGTAIGGAWGTLVGFCLVSPLILIGYGPATIYRPMLSQILNFANPTPVNASADTFSIWTLVNWVTGLRGFDRIWAPRALELFGLTFSTLGSVLFGMVALLVAWTLWRSKSETRSEEVFYLCIATVFVAYVAFSTAASARYLLLALPFLILGLVNEPLRTRVWMIGGLTAIAFISIYGVLMEIAVRGDWASFFGLGTPSTNAVSNVAYQIYTSDAGITVLAIVLLLLMQALVLKIDHPADRAEVLGEPGLTAGEASC